MQTKEELTSELSLGGIIVYIPIFPNKKPSYFLIIEKKSYKEKEIRYDFFSFNEMRSFRPSSERLLWYPDSISPKGIKIPRNGYLKLEDFLSRKKEFASLLK